MMHSWAGSVVGGDGILLVHQTFAYQIVPSRLDMTGGHDAGIANEDGTRRRDMTHKRPRSSLWVVLAGMMTLGTLAGCASDSSSMKKESTDYVVTGLGDDQDEALEAVKARALEQCESEDRERFVILDQQMMGPDDAVQKSTNASSQLEGATVNEDSELQAATQEGDGYKATWTIHCR